MVGIYPALYSSSKEQGSSNALRLFQIGRDAYDEVAIAGPDLAADDVTKAKLLSPYRKKYDTLLDEVAVLAGSTPEDVFTVLNPSLPWSDANDV